MYIFIVYILSQKRNATWDKYFKKLFLIEINVFEYKKIYDSINLNPN
jgi:hypothetical protein